jgi:hypothetical protein
VLRLRSEKARTKNGLSEFEYCRELANGSYRFLREVRPRLCVGLLLN